MNLDKPISRFVYKVEQKGNAIWYVLTEVKYYYSTVSFYVDEQHLFKTKRELISKVNS